MGISAIADLKGHFTINLSDKLFEEGFSLSEDISFKIPTSRLFGTPAINVPCISIVDIPKNINEFTGTHNASHFGYTFYLRNEGKTEADYQWELSFTSKSELSKAVWVMLFVDGDMTIYAQADKDGKPAKFSDIQPKNVLSIARSRETNEKKANSGSLKDFSISPGGLMDKAS